MTNRLYGSLVSSANSTTASQKGSSYRVSIGWWLIPSLIFYLLTIAIFR
jgi:hypothetical protein